MNNVIYHINLGLAITKGTMENEEFSTVSMEEPFYPEHCTFVRHEDKSYITFSNESLEQEMIAINEQIEAVKALLVESDQLVVMGSDEIAATRQGYRDQIFNLEQAREVVIGKQILLGEKYKLLKHIEGADEDISYLVFLLNNIIGIYPTFEPEVPPQPEPEPEEPDTPTVFDEE